MIESYHLGLEIDLSYTNINGEIMDSEWYAENIIHYMTDKSTDETICELAKKMYKSYTQLSD